MPEVAGDAIVVQPNAGQDKRAKTEGGGGKGSEENNGKLFMLVARLLLATTRGMADLSEAVSITYEMSAVQGFPAALVAARKQYGVKSKELADRAKGCKEQANKSGVEHIEGEAEEERQLRSDAEEFWTSTVASSNILMLGDGESGAWEGTSTD
ncbi:unnamed protein product [Prorocentrum cordatum]|uniref:Uncharacterized protein n=1 Tax=Prorocentrum cordatum TaxID=2364126 RepID=A0ABN9UN76_9DINO|nr:unnamed protein product [Polarella glacialis]